MDYEFRIWNGPYDEPTPNSYFLIPNPHPWDRMASKSGRSARVGHTPFPAERGADARRPVAATHLRGALQADGERVSRAGGRVRDGLRRRVGNSGGGLHGQNRGAR